MPIWYDRRMTIDEYLRKHKIAEAKFGLLVGVSQAAIHRYRKGRMPREKVLAKIREVTKGAVNPNDFVPKVTQ